MTTLVQPTTEPALRVGGLVLAAGAGSRMGNRPKCLLQLNGMSLLERQLQALSLAGVRPVGVVLGHHGERILQEGILTRWAAQQVRNLRPDDGHVSSLRIGLKDLPTGLDAVVVALADQPLIDVQAVKALLAAFAQRPAGTQMLQPSVKGLPGNPVVFSGEVMAQILAGEEHIGARQWQQAHPEAVFRWETPHSLYRLDVDNEADRQAVEASTGRSLHWPPDLVL
ncbi:NTP transferase domain-containing protein [Limnohabitans sp. Bal53]|uniref:nucleotidyltransferase family protein n=1 Tax=Limnohabitans sp. Bal53 TaxID=1977910 RepID=UPI001E324607|nr:nucleotidyltransferase family protein [Limnohabitans sp. Bal53]